MKMSELTKELNARGIKAELSMSGGGIGTIYIGKADEDGDYEFAVGPGSFGADEIHRDEICWGRDGSEVAQYYCGSDEDFTPAKVADLIANDYNKDKKERAN